jgi:hypothetical protein
VDELLDGVSKGAQRVREMGVAAVGTTRSFGPSRKHDEVGALRAAHEAQRADFAEHSEEYRCTGCRDE